MHPQFLETDTNILQTKTKIKITKSRIEGEDNRSKGIALAEGIYRQHRREAR